MIAKNMIAVIPARGGSKRIPKKNITAINGKPMIAWTIEAALKSKYISKVLVSTDDPEIAEVARHYGADVPFLRERNADDFSPSSLATIASLEQLTAAEGCPHEIVLQLLATCPLRTANDIDDAVENFVNHNHTFQLSCYKFGWMNPWWAHKIAADGTAVPLFKEERMRRSQDQEDLYCPTGAVWIAKIKDLFLSQTFYGEGYIFHPMNWVNALDIDNPEDIEMVNYFAQKLKLN